MVLNEPSIILMIENIGSLFTEQSQSYAQYAYQIALQHRHSTIEEAHVFLALLQQPDELLVQLFRNMPLDVEELKQEITRALRSIRKVPFWKGRNYKFFTTSIVKRSLEGAVSIARELGEEKASSIHIFWGVVNSSLQAEQNGMAQILRKNNITTAQVFEALKKVEYDSQDNDETGKEE